MTRECESALSPIETTVVDVAPSLLESAPEEAVSEAEAKAASSFASKVMALVACGMYLAAGPGLILLNKYIMKDVGFKFPFIVSGLGQLFSAGGTYLLFNVFELMRLEHKTVEPEARKSMLVIGSCSAVTLYFGSLVYMYLTVSFIQMLKAFTPCVTMVFLVVFAIDFPSKRVAASVGFICVGTAIASMGEANFNLIGMMMVVGSMLAESLKLVLTQKLMGSLKFGAVEGLYHAAPICTGWLFLFAVFVELPTIVKEEKYVLVQENVHLFLLSGCFGFLVNVSSFLVIKRTSAVTLKVMSTARNAALVLYSVMLEGEFVSQQQFFGYGLALTAFGFYNYYKLVGK